MRTLIIGANGFVGRSLSLQLPLEIRSVVGTSRAFVPKQMDFEFVRCDIQDPILLRPDFDLIFHLGSNASADENVTSPLQMFSSIVNGTSNVIDFCSRHSKPPRLVFASSGGVYGEMPDVIDQFPEDWYGAVSTTKVHSAYAEGKRAAEYLLTEATSRNVCLGLIARLFSFSGSNLPSGRHFAIENFVRDAVTSQKIVIRSDGSSIRTYLDQVDLCHWLWKIALQGRPLNPYHIGSERAVSIKELAQIVSNRHEELTGKSVFVQTLGQTSAIDGVNRYVPSTKWTREELGLSETISLESSIDSMIQAAISKASC